MEYPTTQQALSLPNDLADATPQIIDKVADQKGKEFNKIKTNQIRNVFSHINKIRTTFKNQKEWTAEIERDLVLLRPKLAYAAGRQNVVKQFQEFLSKQINATVSSKDKIKALENFFALVEAIVAYHKFHGGRDN